MAKDLTLPYHILGLLGFGVVEDSLSGVAFATLQPNLQMPSTTKHGTGIKEAVLPTRSIPMETPPQRVVSLVPSLTESLFDLGLASTLVGISDYCIYPEDKVRRLPRVGGTKTARVEDILELKPELVIANQEENDRGTIEALMERDVPVWLTFPCTVNEAIEDLWSLARLYQNEAAMMTLNALEKSLEYAHLATVDQTPIRYFCPIWQETASAPVWWMTFNRLTYSGDLLAMLGGENIFADRERRYPLEADLGQAASEAAGERDTRYPRVSLEEVLAARPEIVLLPSEPYPFGDEDARQIQEWLQPLQESGLRIVLIDGSLITWPGTRLGKALSELGAVFG
jgi:ABC-type Fe3+-hydroxamate transport system substrate-binding protein